jgi:hypothetical protein
MHGIPFAVRESAGRINQTGEAVASVASNPAMREL